VKGQKIIVEKYEKKILEILGEDPIEILKRNKVFVRKLKEENERLKKEIKILMRNNKTLTELVEVLEEKLLNHTKRRSKKYSDEKYIYDYERGGWIELSSLDEEKSHKKLELHEKDLSIHRINLQLTEINRLMKLLKEKHLREEQEINK